MYLNQRNDALELQLVQKQHRYRAQIIAAKGMANTFVVLQLKTQQQAIKELVHFTTFDKHCFASLKKLA